MSQKLRQARIEAGLTMQEVANKADVSRPTMEKAEGGRPIRYVYAVKIVNALNELAGTDYTVESLQIVTA